MEPKTKKILRIVLFSIITFIIILGLLGFFIGNDLDNLNGVTFYISSPALGIILGILFYSSNQFREIWNGENIIKKIFSTIGGIILVIFTTIVSWIIFLIYFLWTGATEIAS